MEKTNGKTINLGKFKTNQMLRFLRKCYISADERINTFKSLVLSTTTFGSEIMHCSTKDSAELDAIAATALKAITRSDRSCNNIFLIHFLGLHTHYSQFRLRKCSAYKKILTRDDNSSHRMVVETATDLGLVENFGEMSTIDECNAELDRFRIHYQSK